MRDNTPAAPLPTPRRLLLALALGYTAFVVYGSLVPLQFRAYPLHEAVARFRELRYLWLDIGSRVDWVANILLFVPLSFLWLGTLWSTRKRLAGVLASSFVLLACAALSTVIEFAQIFFPPRNPSFNDILAQVLGATVGIALWWSVGRRVAGWLNGWSKAHTRASAAERLLHPYLVLLLAYNLLPLDLTISVVEIFHKWREGKVVLVPFSVAYATRAEAAYALLSGIAIWIPAAFLWRLSSERPGRVIVLYVLACAAAIEFLQLFVYSRVSSTTDLLTAVIGAAIGVFLGNRIRSRAGDRGAAHAAAPRTPWGVAVVWLLLLVAWLGVLAAVFWYPFDFRTDWGFVHARVAALKRVPFETYYFGTELRAVTEVLHKTGFFFPLGAWLAVGARWLSHRIRLPAAVFHAASALAIACAAAAIEAGQLFLPGKIADATDWTLATLGGLAGYLCLWVLLPAWQSGGSRWPRD